MDITDHILEAIDNPQVNLNTEYLKQNNVPNATILKLGHLKGLLQENQLAALQNQIILNQGLTKSAEDTFRVIHDIKNQLCDTVKVSGSSQSLIKWMFGLMFFLGFGLIIIAVIFAFRGETFFAIAFGTFGMSDIIAQLMADPPLKIQDSRSNYTQLTVGVLAWFSDFIDKSTIAGQYHAQSIQSYQTSGLSFDERFKIQKESMNNYLTISDAQVLNTSKFLQLIEELTEPTSKKKIREVAKKEAIKVVKEEIKEEAPSSNNS